MSRERMRYGAQLGQTEAKPTPEEIAEAKAERERGLDLTIRNSAAQLAIQAIGAGPHANDHLGDASLVEIAEDLYSFLKGTN